MKLRDILHRKSPPLPWQEGENIPWFETGFSERMLREHLAQDHDLASRRQLIIDQHVNWIHETLLEGKPGKILDLGCGPGLYTQKLAEGGHRCLGIDYSPASITYAREAAQAEDLNIEYQQEDVRSADYGDSYDLVMMLFGEFNIFQMRDGELILQKAYKALIPGGILLLEPHLYEDVKKVEKSAFTWFTAQSGLFSDKPHICLEESYWDE
jgi:2-polyprenyl-3-methyl-5-hydroxy-6-metoxy-1,4-benzoquinol methylase